jgi:hypothetical protein
MLCALLLPVTTLMQGPDLAPIEVEAVVDSKTTIRRAIEQAYDAYQVAIAKLDIDQIKVVWHPKYQQIDREGFVTGVKELEAGYRAQAKLGLRDPGRRAAKVMKFRIFKSGDVQTRVFYSVAFDLPRAPLAQKEEKVQWEEHQDVWRSTDGRWQLFRSEKLREWSEIRRKRAS